MNRDELGRVEPESRAMTTPELLSRLDQARARGTGKWAARCPAHADNSPSLSITEGERGILVKCWAGCTLDEITAALGIRVADLFADALDTDPRRRREAAQERDRRRDARERHVEQQGTLIDVLREADGFVRSRQGLDVSAWSHDRLNDDLNAVADAYHLLEREDCHGCSR